MPANGRRDLIRRLNIKQFAQKYGEFTLEKMLPPLAIYMAVKSAGDKTPTCLSTADQ